MNPPVSTSLPDAFLLPSVFRAFRHRNYRLFSAGQFASLCGTWMHFLAQSWLVYRLTGSTVWLGIASFSANIPVLFFSPLGGLLADRLPRRRILLATQFLTMLLTLVLAALTLAGAVQVWHVLAIAVLLGCVAAFDIPARQALTADLVGKEDLLNAIALNSSMFNAARIIGPALAGLVVSLAGEGWCFLITGALVLAARSGVRGLERWIALSGVIFGVCLILFSVSRHFWLSCALLVPIGFATIGQLASLNTLVQIRAPDPLRGRLMSLYSMLLIGMAPFGSLLAGTLAHHIGAPKTVALSGVCCLAGATIFGFRNRLPWLGRDATGRVCSGQPKLSLVAPD